MALNIEPVSAMLSARDTQLFRALNDGKPVLADWTVVGQGTIGETGAYSAPFLVFVSKQATVVARAKTGGEESAATVMISAAHTWIPLLGAYLGVSAAALLATLYFAWLPVNPAWLALGRGWLPILPGWVAFLAGALGACLHGINSLVSYVGNRQFASSWAPFYLFRPFAGGILATIVFWVFKAGLISTPIQDADFYLVAAIAGLVGLFSDIAMKKLEDVVTSIFSGKPDQRTDKLSPAKPPKPSISGTNPANPAQTGQAQPLEITGTGLEAGIKVKVNGTERNILSQTPPTTVVIELTAADVRAPGQLRLVVETSQGVASDEFTVTVV